MRTRIAMIVLLGISLSLHSGCATMLIRGHGELASPSLYPATQVNVGAAMTLLFDRQDTFSGTDALIILPSVVVDFPISLTVDTVLLPLDIYSALRHDKEHRAPVRGWWN